MMSEKQIVTMSRGKEKQEKSYRHLMLEESNRMEEDLNQVVSQGLWAMEIAEGVEDE